MQIEELKKNMSVLDQVLAKTSTEIEINREPSETAQTKILKKYGRAAIQCLIISAAFCCLWMGNVEPVKLPNMLKGFIVILCGMAGAWYILLFTMLKKIKLASLTPREVISKTTLIKIMTLSGEIFLDIALTVFFTLFLSEMFGSNQLAFWLTISLLAIVLTFSVIYFWPKYIRLFNDLNSIK